MRKFFGLALIVGSIAAVIYGFHLDTSAGDCVTYGGSTSCGGGPGDLFIIGGSVFLTAGVTVLVAGGLITSGLTARRIRQNGRDATATILSVGETGVTVNNSPMVRLGLQVVPADGSPPYKAQVKKLVSRLAIPRPGEQVYVRYLPADPSKVTIVAGSARPSV